MTRDLLAEHLARLGLERGASAEDVRRRYRDLARRHHPDVARAPDAAERFKCISESYEFLIRRQARASAAAAAAGGGGGIFTDVHYHYRTPSSATPKNGPLAVMLLVPALLAIGIGGWAMSQTLRQRGQPHLRAGGTSRYVPEQEPIVIRRPAGQQRQRRRRREAASSGVGDASESERSRGE